jgi:hypothetical protein
MIVDGHITEIEVYVRVVLARRRYCELSGTEKPQKTRTSCCPEHDVVCCRVRCHPDCLQLTHDGDGNGQSGAGPGCTP